jgi:hypothetical protein
MKKRPIPGVINPMVDYCCIFLPRDKIKRLIGYRENDGNWDATCSPFFYAKSSNPSCFLIHEITFGHKLICDHQVTRVFEEIPHA